MLLTPGVGVWKLHGDNKIRLQGTHIGYKLQNGNPEVYYSVHIKSKVHRHGTRMSFHGEAIPHDIKDPTLCTPASEAFKTVCFTGCGVKLLNPPKE